MKLVRFGECGAERPGVLLGEADAGRILDVRAMAFDIEDYNERFFAQDGLKRIENLLKESGRKLVPAEGVRLGPPVARPGKIICLGKNYAAHAREFDASVPAAPILFAKAASAMVGPRDNIVLPPRSRAVDGEVELAVVIGKKAKNISEEQAFEHVAGYAIFNDVTDREAQRADQQWFRAKSADTFCPLGPWLATRDEVKNPGRLGMQFIHNGRVLQNDSTENMIFKIPFILSFISSAITLFPGDVIATGTPAGIGSLQNPPALFRPGDEIELAIEGLGRQANKIVAAGL
ncbi:MAG: fumarylacetoacetate hydrolase family protein [Kiritimatiellae bacterium]|nr:fumarylacetoacetate hydrolase family protein [Kiritimatiellia bacterium]